MVSQAYAKARVHVHVLRVTKIGLERVWLVLQGSSCSECKEGVPQCDQSCSNRNIDMDLACELYWMQQGAAPGDHLHLGFRVHPKWEGIVHSSPAKF
jgi:hypothetical protein